MHLSPGNLRSALCTTSLALALLAPAQGQEPLPIGAWFAAPTNNVSGTFADRLDQIASAGFNTVHAPLEVRNTVGDNAALLWPIRSGSKTA